MTKLIVNADDMGFCEAVNYGIISAYQNGIVRSCTIMAGMPGFEHAVKLLKENPGLGCGVHLTLSLEKPILSCAKTIVDETGYFYRRITNELVEQFDLQEVYEEFCAQIEKVKEAGIVISHLDSHHHVHTLKNLAPVIKQLVDKYQLPIRGGFETDIQYDKVIPLIDSFYGEQVRDDYFELNIAHIREYACVDLMSHPAFVDEYLTQKTSYGIQRMKEYSILTDSKVKKFLEVKQIKLTNYKEN
ncbi:MAG: chitin disaccharide deacetylase [Cellulosilyticaceae bacterium]